MQHKKQGLLLVVSGPAGVGKGTIDSALIARNPSIRMSVSATTRKPRPGEVDGVHYFFKTHDEFRQMIEENDFLEYMHVFQQNYYGTPRSFVEQELALGHHVILEIDVHGAFKVKESFPEAVLIFIAPPSMEILKQRLIGRGTETPEDIERRYATAALEVVAMKQYDYVVINEKIEVGVSQMEAIITAELCRVARNNTMIANLIGGND